MTVAGIIWIVTAPYLTGLAVARSPRVRHVVARHLTVLTLVGWTSLAAVIAGAFVISGHTGALIMLATAPLVGLAFWVGGPGGDDGRPDPLPDDPAPSDEGIDWDEVLRWINDEARERERIPV